MGAPAQGLPFIVNYDGVITFSNVPGVTVGFVAPGNVIRVDTASLLGVSGSSSNWQVSGSTTSLGATAPYTATLQQRSTSSLGWRSVSNWVPCATSALAAVCALEGYTELRGITIFRGPWGIEDINTVESELWTSGLLDNALLRVYLRATPQDSPSSWGRVDIAQTATVPEASSALLLLSAGGWLYRARRRAAERA